MAEQSPSLPAFRSFLFVIQIALVYSWSKTCKIEESISNLAGVISGLKSSLLIEMAIRNCTPRNPFNP